MRLDTQDPAHDQLQAGSDVVAGGNRCSAASEPDRSHWGFLCGLEAYRLGQPENWFPAGTLAAAQFKHGWNDAEAYAAECDRQNEMRFDLTYCPPT